MEPTNKHTQKSKNTPPAGYLIALAIIVGLILFYFVLSAIFPELFEDLSQGKDVALLTSKVLFSSI